MKKEFRGISRRSQQLLRLPEGVNVDFKRDLGGLKSRSLVSFANNATGGAILIGVDEYTTEDGVQRGMVVGCPVDDAARLSIVNKATDCIPNIHLDIYVENINRIPFLRIEIPSGKHKPYCNQRGEYAIRTDGRSRALFPEELLAIFMDREGEQFLSRFRNAVYQLENKVGIINEALNEGMVSVGGHLASLDSQIRDTLDSVILSSVGVEQNSSALLKVLRESNGYIHRLEGLLTQGADNGQAESIERLRLAVMLLARMLKQAGADGQEREDPFPGRLGDRPVDG